MDVLDLKLTRIAHKTSNPINLTTMDTLPLQIQMLHLQLGVVKGIDCMNNHILHSFAMRLLSNKRFHHIFNNIATTKCFFKTKNWTTFVTNIGKVVDPTPCPIPLVIWPSVYAYIQMLWDFFLNDINEKLHYKEERKQPPQHGTLGNHYNLKLFHIK